MDHNVRPRTILNLTQHAATAEQLNEGVVDCTELDRKTLQNLLTFVGLPDKDTVWTRAEALALIPKLYGATHAMIGGAPFIMMHLHEALLGQGITPLYAFSERVSTETVGSDGVVYKAGQFRHLGFVEL